LWRRRLAAGGPLPSTRELAVDHGVYFHTVHKAYDGLRRDALVRLTRREGTPSRSAGPACARLAPARWRLAGPAA
jgi:DNA-binding transcriptional regulator YhcF (GntR family)